MIYNTSNQYERQKCEEYFKSLLEQKALVEIKKKHPQRTLRQNNYLYLLFGWFACEYGCTSEEAKIDFYKRTCNREIYEVEKTNKRGEKIRTLRSSASLTTEEMTTSISRFRSWSSMTCGIYLPEPDEDEFLLHIQNEMERNKEFI